jgi:ribosomal protein S18 acetylase RimI-like enzyme
MTAVLACQVREARADDGPALQQLYLRAYVQAFPWRAQPIGLAADSVGEWQLVAEDASGLLGFISSFKADGFIHHLYVDPCAQGRGIGRTLLQAGLAGLPRPARLKCMLRNQAALDFYRHLGWRPAAEQPADAQDYVLLQLDT